MTQAHTPVRSLIIEKFNLFIEITTKGRIVYWISMNLNGSRCIQISNRNELCSFISWRAVKWTVWQIWMTRDHQQRSWRWSFEMIIQVDHLSWSFELIIWVASIIQRICVRIEIKHRGFSLKILMIINAACQSISIGRCSMSRVGNIPKASFRARLNRSFEVIRLPIGFLSSGI